MAVDYSEMIREDMISSTSRLLRSGHIHRPPSPSASRSQIHHSKPEPMAAVCPGDSVFERLILWD